MFLLLLLLLLHSLRRCSAKARWSVGAMAKWQ
jgi:hypothetical protein